MDVALPRHSAIVRQVVPVRSEHIPALTSVLSRAFFNDPLLQFFEPDPTRRAVLGNILHGSFLRYTLKYGRADMSIDGHGVACWLMPNHSRVAFSKIFRAGFWRIGVSASLTALAHMRAYERASNQLRAAVCSKPSWYLWSLGVDPTCQRQGVSKHLFRNVTDRTDRSGESVYVESANPEVVVMLKRFGFEVAHQVSLNHQVTLHGLMREPVFAKAVKPDLATAKA